MYFALLQAALSEGDYAFPKPLTVTVASNPSGTLATMIPMRKMTASSHVYSRIRERMKKDTPRNTATPVMSWIKCSISAAMGVWPPSSPEARVAILPITVRSPVYTTIPRAVPEKRKGERTEPNCVQNRNDTTEFTRHIGRL